MRYSCFALLSLCAFGFGPVAIAQTLVETQKAALSYHPQLAEARTQIKLAEEQKDSAKALKGLSIVLGLNSIAQTQDTDRFFGIDLGETLVNQAQIEATYPLFTSGQIPSAIDQASHFLDATKSGYDAQVQTVLFEAVQAHLDVLRAEQAIEIRQTNKTRLEKQLSAATDRFDVGVITKTDVALSEARFQGSVAGLALAEAELAGAIALYIQQTGKSPVKLIDVDGSADLPGTLEDAFEILEQNNPSLRQLQALERVAKSAIQEAKGSRGTQIEAFGNANIQDGQWDNDFTDKGASIGVRLSRSLYQNGRLLSAERQAVLRAESARLQTQQVRNTLIRQLTSAWSGMLAAEAAVSASKKEVAAAEVALEGAQIELEVGLRTTLELLDQEQNLLEAELRQIDAVRDYQLSRMQILAILGLLSPQTA